MSSYKCQCGATCTTEKCHRCKRHNTIKYNETIGNSYSDEEPKVSLNNDRDRMAEWSRNDVDKFVNGY